MTTADLLFAILLAVVLVGVLLWRRRQLDTRAHDIRALAKTEGWDMDPAADAEVDARLHRFGTLPRHGRRRTTVHARPTDGHGPTVTLFDHDVVTGPDGLRRRHERTFALVPIQGDGGEASLAFDDASAPSHPIPVEVPGGRHELHLPACEGAGAPHDVRSFLELCAPGLVVEAVDGHLLMRRDGGHVPAASLPAFAREARELAVRLG